MRVCLLVLAMFSAFAAPAFSASNYAEALQKSLYFYEAQKAGPLPTGQRVRWRGDAALQDGADQGVNLTGGMFDAGDHVKFAFPMAYTTTMLAWSLAHDEDVYEQTQQRPYALSNLRWMTDWLMKAHTAPEVFWAQVGDAGVDHSFWGPPEVMTMARPATKIDASCPGTDLAAEAAAALAAAAVVFQKDDVPYSAKLVSHARQLYAFADTRRGKYSDCVTGAAGFYQSWSGYQDELVWGAAWLYKATGEASYLAKAELAYQGLPTEGGTQIRPFRFTLNWDDKTYGSYVLLSELTGKAVYEADAERWLDYWTVGVNGEHGPVTPGGLAYLGRWGSLRYASTTAMMALYYGQYLQSKGQKPAKADAYTSFGRKQIDYILGANPAGRSYIVGYGVNPPQKIHHRASHGSWSNDIQVPELNRHILFGALVGGPDQADTYHDSRDDYAVNEVALDYNAGFTGATARLAAMHGGQIEPIFPPAEVSGQEFSLDSKINAQGDGYLEIATKLHDQAGFPARFSSDLRFRYFINLTGVPSTERVGEEVQMTTAYNQSSGVSAVKAWSTEVAGIYFVEVSFTGQKIAPNGAYESTREVQFRFNFPAAWKPYWHHESDWSFNHMGTEWQPNDHIAVYEGERLVFGSEP